MSATPSTPTAKGGIPHADKEAKEKEIAEAKAAKAAADAALVASRPKIHLDILKFLKQSQARHGMRDNQCFRYWRYCARRLNRVRRSIHLTQYVGGGKSGRFKAKPIDALICTTPLHLSVYLIEAERAWAHAMHLQQESTEEINNGAETSRKRFHMMRRLIRAAQATEKLNHLASQVAGKYIYRG